MLDIPFPGECIKEVSYVRSDRFDQLDGLIVVNAWSRQRLATVVAFEEQVATETRGNEVAVLCIRPAKYYDLIHIRPH